MFREAVLPHFRFVSTEVMRNQFHFYERGWIVRATSPEARRSWLAPMLMLKLAFSRSRFRLQRHGDKTRITLDRITFFPKEFERETVAQLLPRS
jgi:hypothetical protein